jgi:hypothetical protein
MIKEKPFILRKIVFNHVLIHIRRERIFIKKMFSIQLFRVLLTVFLDIPRILAVLDMLQLFC